jgi:hypothetical protein
MAWLIVITQSDAGRSLFKGSSFMTMCDMLPQGRRFCGDPGSAILRAAVTWILRQKYFTMELAGRNINHHLFIISFQAYQS